MACIFIASCRLLLPTVVFCFSKKRVDALADNLSRMDLATASEKAEVHIFCERALSRLRGTDKELPQIRRLREMLCRGLGVHHAGAYAHDSLQFSIEPAADPHRTLFYCQFRACREQLTVNVQHSCLKLLNPSLSEIAGH